MFRYLVETAGEYRTYIGQFKTIEAESVKFGSAGGVTFTNPSVAPEKSILVEAIAPGNWISVVIDEEF